ncbi:MAG: DUF262 domain-containing protein [Paludibacteraceae bacterium]|nr:DUF262 domain-containing protein [Paludibacteraceae bacterium]
MKALNIRTLLSNCSGKKNTTTRLIVPEIQREYVWGAKNNVEKLKVFIQDIEKDLKNEKKKNIGFLYSYQAHSNEHYIIDGQQRLTSIVLLLYILAIKEDKYDEFAELLKVDSPTLQFSYNVRPLTEQFLHLLFQERDFISANDIKDKIWYIRSFDNDKTIESMLNALDTMQNMGLQCQFDKILDNVEFWYFDVAQTSQGEELYISMNSRGQKLTQSEHLKPKLFDKLKDNNINYGKEWDNWEEFFFVNKPQESLVGADDVALHNFLKIVIELFKQKSADQNIINDVQYIDLPNIKHHFDNFEKLHQQNIVDRALLNSFYNQDIKNVDLFVLEALLGTYDKLDGNLQELNRLLRIVKNTLIYNPNTSIENLHKFIGKIKGPNLYAAICQCPTEYVQNFNGQITDGFIPIEEFEKIVGIEKGFVNEQNIIEAEQFAFFNSKIHALYRNENGKLDWGNFQSKLSNAKKYFDNNGVTIAYSKDCNLLRRFISYFDTWGCFWGIRYDNTADTWKEILTKNWDINNLPSRIPAIHRLLLLDEQIDFANYESIINQANEQQKIVQKELVSTNLLTAIEKGCYLNWRDPNYLLYPYNVKSDRKKYMIGTIRNHMLSSLCNEGKICSEQKLIQSDYFWGWTIHFSYDKKHFAWTYNNVLELWNNQEIIQRVSLSECINSSDPKRKFIDILNSI